MWDVAARLLAAVALAALAARPAAGADVQRFGVFDQAFTQSGSYGNPYTGTSATAAFTRPGGGTVSIPLFWDGGTTWRVRFSPDVVGQWSYVISSGDAGLNGKAGVFNAVASASHGGIQPMAGSPYHFQYQDGTPFWWMGDTEWKLYGDDAAESHSRTSAFHYIDTRAAQGFNVVHSSAYAANSGGATFTNLAGQQINPAFFQEMDLRVQRLNEKGIAAGVVLAWAQDWAAFPSQAAREKYAEYVTARYAAYNAYFIISGEWEETLSESNYTAIGQKVAATDPHDRLVGVHPTGAGTAENFADLAWCSFGAYQQVYTTLHAKVLGTRDHSKPVINAEYAYFLRDQDGDGLVDKPNSGTIADIRHATWDIAMAGGYFVTGFATTYNGGTRDPGPFNVDAAKNDPWEAQVQHVRTLFASLDWWTLSPADGLMTAPVARGSDTSTPDPSSAPVESYNRPPKTTYWCLADLGELYVAYARGYQGDYALALTGASPDDVWNLARYDPRTGTFADLGQYTGSGPIIVTTPDTSDWVFVAKIVPEPGSLALLGLGLAAMRRLGRQLRWQPARRAAKRPAQP